MEEQTLQSILNSVNKLNSGKIRFGFEPDQCGFCPAFYGKRSNINCHQSKFFGFYALRNALRGFLLGTNYLVAGQRILKEKLYGPAVTCYYTSAFHSTVSFLALHGRVLIDLQTAVIKPGDDLGELIVGVFTKQGSWKFEPRTRSHKSIWKELIQVLTPTEYRIPRYFTVLQEYLFKGRYKDELDIKDYLQKLAAGKQGVNRGTRFEIREVLPEFLDLIAETRHGAIYNSFGSDVDVYEALVNNDSFSSIGLNERSQQFCSFANAMYSALSDRLLKITAKIDLSDSVRSFLVGSVHHPWFDEPRINSLFDADVRNRVKDICHWLLGPSSGMDRNVVKPNKSFS